MEGFPTTGRPLARFFAGTPSDPSFGEKSIRSTDVSIGRSDLRVTFSAPINLVGADGESLGIAGGGPEQLRLITNGGVWEVVDRFRPGGFLLSGAETNDVLVVGNTEVRSEQGTPVLVSRSATTVTITIQSPPGGLTGVALGVLLGDSGDAPAPSGAAPHEADSANPACPNFSAVGPYLGTIAPAGTWPALVQSADASGDSADDGVTLPPLTQGQSGMINVDVTQSSGNEGYLQV